MQCLHAVVTDNKLIVLLWQHLHSSIPQLLHQYGISFKLHGRKRAWSDDLPAILILALNMTTNTCGCGLTEFPCVTWSLLLDECREHVDIILGMMLWTQSQMNDIKGCIVTIHNWRLFWVPWTASVPFDITLLTVPSPLVGSESGELLALTGLMTYWHSHWKFMTNLSSTSTTWQNRQG